VLRDSINAGHIEGPRVLAAGIWVGSKGGVCEFTGIGIAGDAQAFVERVTATQGSTAWYTPRTSTRRSPVRCASTGCG
jgi:hypothetical protein